MTPTPLNPEVVQIEAAFASGELTHAEFREALAQVRDDGYPPEWPRCACGLPVLDGHLTCGRLECDEARARRVREANWRPAHDRT